MASKAHNYICDQCDKSYINERDLRRHQRNKHAPAEAGVDSRDPAKYHIRDVDPSESWFVEDEEGDVWIREATILGHGGEGGSGYIWLSSSARVALACSEYACEQKSGKVYTFMSHRKGLLERARFDSNLEFWALPDLFYIPEQWSSSEQQEWQSLRPDKRLHRLTARHGLVPDRMPVLPFAVEVEEDQRDRPEFAGESQALITVLFSPRTYVGPTESIRNLCKGGFKGKDAPTRYTFVSKQKGWSGLEQWRVRGMRGVVQKLDEIYWKNMQDCEESLEFYGALKERLISAAKSAADHGQSYGVLGELVNLNHQS